MTDPLIKRVEFERSQNTAWEAGKELNVTQLEVNKERIIAAERVGWFCAGAISLSFTLIGYLFSNIQAKQVLGGYLSYYIPLISLLILAWACLLMSVLASLLVRLWNASYLSYNKAHYWSSKNREEKEKMLEAIEAGLEVLFTDVDNSEQAVKNITESKNNYAGLEKSFGFRAKFWIKAANFAQATIYVGAVIGFLLLGLFLIIVTYKLVYF